MENCLAAAPDDPWRGHDGPLVLERGPATNPLFQAFFAACQEAGYHLTDDVNGYRQEGFAPFDRNIHDGRRLSASQAYLKPVRRRKNLTVRTRTLVTGVVFEGRRAVAVDIERQGGGTERIEGGEIILAGGAINSPQLLQLSGVGRAADLEALGIPVVADLPGVGANLQDHLEVYIQYTLAPAGLDAAVGDAALAPAVHRGAVAVPAQRARGDQPFRGRRLRPLQRGGRLPEPDVPLPAARHPLRRECRGRRATATRSTSGRCTPTPADPSRSRPPTRTTIPRSASTTCRRSRTGANGSRRCGSPGTSSTSRRWIPTTAERRHPGRS